MGASKNGRRRNSGATPKKDPPPKPPPDWIEPFLEAFAETCKTTEAATRAGVDRVTVWRRRRSDPTFRRQYDEVEKAITMALEEEAQRRAVEGVAEPVFHQGKQISTIQKYSDVLLIFLLKARDPQKYREVHRLEHVGASVDPADQLTDEELRERLAPTDNVSSIEEARRRKAS